MNRWGWLGTAFLTGFLAGLVFGGFLLPKILVEILTMAQYEPSPTILGDSTADTYEDLMRKSDELFTMAQIETSTTLLGLQALREGNLACAYCLFEFDLHQKAEDLESFIPVATEEVGELARQKLEPVRSYLAEYPFDERACEGVCVVP